MATKKTKKKGKQTTKKNERNLSLEIMGFIFIICSLFGLIKLGFVGVIIVNIFRFFYGDIYILGLILLAVYGGYLLIIGKEPKLASKRMLGVLFVNIAILLFAHAHIFGPVMSSKPQVIEATWRYYFQDLTGNTITKQLGGGMIGAVLYVASYFLFSQLGTYMIASLLLIIGGMLIANIPLSNILTYSKKGLQAVGLKIGEIIKKQRAKKKLAKETAQQEEAVEKANQVVPPTPGQLLAKEQKEPEKGVTEQIELKIDSFQSNPSIQAEEKSAAEEPDKGEELDFPIAEETEDYDYKLPPHQLLKEVEHIDQSQEYDLIQQNVKKLEETFASFGVDAKVTKANLGPAVTKYEVQPAVGVKVSKVVGLSDDLALALAAKDIRIEAPIPGKSFIGIEVPNSQVSMVAFRDVIEGQVLSPERLLEVPLGRDISGNVMVADLAKMPHLLVAGSTGSGKSVCINGIITSLLMRAKPHEVKLMMVDPKMVELNVYNGIPHLLTPVVTNPRKAAQALQKVVAEMERRYELFAASGMRNITGYNEMVREQNIVNGENHPIMPYIVVVVDELADLMMVASNEVEDAITRLAQMARAAGIHMILATQRPSVDVITGIIKANVPSRIAFAVSSSTDSRTIIDGGGAEKLLGRGDMLFLPMGESKPVRVQGAFISDKEVEDIVHFITEQRGADYQEDMMPVDEPQTMSGQAQDELFDEAVALVVEMETASVSMLQRRFRIGYNRAARLIDEMEQRGIVGPHEGSKPRKVHVSSWPQHEENELETEINPPNE
ncbi:FtsK/SpoIIIE family DNA translocase [Isobaculum melis]|uniref:DNA translocase FtsK n=1 Tax=Isobaculum melis TaxID=142588 RepID=A0A1H9UHA0_9LACT|nr:DNA translocase FtsK [Isobaculum melis]SES08537.1 DNA segregation ATPase FtsK/SpoIIIE, S-DNA-T family [Isobaculum melis]